MSIFYRGAGIDTYWHLHNPTDIGFTARAPEVPSTTARLMQHISNGSQEFLLGVVNPRIMGHFLEQHSQQPPSSEGTPRPPNLTLELETLVRPLRDAEILAYGTIPATCVVNCFDVYVDMHPSE